MLIKDTAGGCTRCPNLRSRHTLPWIIAFILVAFLTRSFAQTGLEEVHITPRSAPAVRSDKVDDPNGNTSTKTLKSNVDLVLVPVTITDSMNRLVLGLEKDNFQVYENKQLMTIQNISNEDVPISVGVIFDSSGSMASKVDRARDAVLEFFRTANPRDEFFVIGFSDRPEKIADFTSSTDDLENKLLYTRPKGSTALLDAIYVGISEMRNARYSKKALLVISDGGDNHSRYTERDIKSSVKEADVMIFAIGVYDRYFQTQEERLGPALLNDICDLSGGRAFQVDNPNDLADVATKIGVELRNQYVIGYRPENQPHDGKWHKIKVKLLPPKGLPQLFTFAKQGYYAPSD
jgi:Ca-activated chloride channel homolog